MMAPRILVIDHRMPRPDRDSGSACTFSYLQILSGAGFNVSFLPADMDDAGPYGEAVRRLGVWTPARYATRLEAVVRAQAHLVSLVLVFRAPVAHRLHALVRAVAPRAKFVFHTVDLHFLRGDREAALSGSEQMSRHAASMRVIELNLIDKADATIVVSSHEYALLGRRGKNARLHHIPILRKTPAPAGRQRLLRPLSRIAGRLGLSSLLPSSLGKSLRLRNDIVFLGGFEHAPNADGVRWFIAEVWPLLQARSLNLRLVIAGSALPPDIAALAGGDIAIPGHVTDLAGLFAAARMSIAPLRFGAGVKGKVVSSLSYGVPVVATSIGAEGARLGHGYNILIADDPAAMADEIERLATDDVLWRRLSHAGYETFMAEFSYQAGAPKVLALINGLLGR